jgi:hypothetical protein
MSDNTPVDDKLTLLRMMESNTRAIRGALMTMPHTPEVDQTRFTAEMLERRIIRLINDHIAKTSDVTFLEGIPYE